MNVLTPQMENSGFAFMVDNVRVEGTRLALSFSSSSPPLPSLSSHPPPPTRFAADV